MQGEVKFFNESKGYGFITYNSDKDMFFHITEVMNAEQVNQGDKVEFSVGEWRNGRECAIQINVVG